MELDDFKNDWNTIGIQSGENDALLSLLKGNGKSPLALIQRKLKFTMLFFPLALIAVGGSLLFGPFNLLMLVLFIILSIEFIFAALNFRTVNHLTRMQGSVKENILNKMRIIKGRLTLYRVLHMLLYALLIVLLEISIYHSGNLEFEWWNKIHFLIRTGLYIIFLVFQYRVKRSEYNEYARYMQQLNKLANDL
jgi:glucan phosphoethanolaminetransferase (alkaline phosphatase superfamily)